MAITTNINETIHLRDNWNQQVAPAATGETETINETIHLRDAIAHGVTGGVVDGDTMFINEEIHLRDVISRSLFSANSISINETIHLRDALTRSVEVGGMWEWIGEEIHLRDEHSVSVKENYVYTYNENISFGETKEPGYKEYSHRFRWTNYNGVAVPDMNYKDLKEPIVRMMPAPSFLQFEYANSFLLFTRNSINRFVLTPDVETGQWRARTDNLIEEFKDLGLMAPKTLVLAGDTLFGLSEKGVWKWNKKGLDLISDKILALPDAGDYEYIAFYNSIRNQYILHRQESSGTYLQLSSGTPVELPDGSGSSGIGQACVVMLSNTKFAILHFVNSNDGYVNIGEIDTIAQSVAYGADYITYGRENNKSDMIPMQNGNVVCVTTNQSGQPRKAYGGVITGTAVAFGAQVDVTGGATDYSKLVKFSETRFAIFHNQTDYYTATIDAAGIITLDTLQTNWIGSSWIVFDSVYIGNGISIIVYAVAGGNLFARTVEDNGDGTINFGTALDTGLSYNNGYEIDVKAASNTLIFIAACVGDDLKLIPLTLTDTTLTKGTLKTKTGYFDSGNNHTDLQIVPKGTSGFWLFFEDARNNSYLTAMWGAGSAVDMVMAESIVTVVQDFKTYEINAEAIVGGFALLHYGEGNALTDDGYGSIWGLEYANIDSWVYQIDRDKWGRFLGMDILDIPVILSGGSLDENYNLWLDSDRQLMKYPGTAYTAVEAVIRTKEFYIEKGAFQRWMVDFEGSGVDVETRVKKMVSGSVVNEEDIKYSVEPNKWRGISLDKQRGYQMSMEIVDANIIKAFSFDAKKWGEQ